MKYNKWISCLEAAELNVIPTELIDFTWVLQLLVEGDGRGGPGGIESDHELAGLEGVDDQLDELHVVVNQPVGLQ